ncbi:Transcription factor lhw [Thalictrum thalictroides]|uniref:Transcription factor lhw n=1 Tax=Thalictrum thalictroides TaxID=46969 RepID=A0A7J6VLS5_THATH|nr:Transcription factor lhw [Thalictrum thalictroides]
MVSELDVLLDHNEHEICHYYLIASKVFRSFLFPFLQIMENMGFINDVKSLFAQLGCAPALSYDCYTTTNPDQKIASPPLFGIPISADSARNSCSQMVKLSPIANTYCSQETSTSQASGFASQPPHSFITQNQAYMQSKASALRTTPIMSKSASDFYQVKSPPVTKPQHPINGQLGTRTVGAQVILCSPNAQLNQRDSQYQSSSRPNEQLVQPGSSFNGFMKQGVPSVGLQGPATSKNTNTFQLRSYGDRIPNSVKDSVIVSLLSGNRPPNASNDVPILTAGPNSVTSSSTPLVENFKFSSSDKSVVSISNQGNIANNNYMLPGVSHRSLPSRIDNLTSSKLTKGKQVMENDLFQAHYNPLDLSSANIPQSGPMFDYLPECSASSSRQERESLKFLNASEGACVQIPSGDDLFDILGLDFKSKQLYGSWNSFLIHGEDAKPENSSIDVSACTTQTEAGREVNDSISESGIFNGTGSDHLLDAVVSKVHSNTKQNSDDDMSCWTTLTQMSNSSVLTDSLKGGRNNVPDQKQVKMFSFPTSVVKSQLTGSSSFRTGCSLDNAGKSSQINSANGSQISLLCEDGPSMKRDNSISTAHSKRPDETGKQNRKRLRPGENPRPRPKDRQMIQDRVKELREIVPNGAKCSIDALLERTIKHMLFLQSVTKHAEKLKHSGESKIISKDGGLLLEDNFDGGATWAFEVGSQSMVCPIIVEDLNTPRQMLVEMLCEEQGFFLEIADIIRGLGLTILKGVMEARNDKVWVRFTVEANRDVTRMEIFLSLVHLLEQAMKSSTSARGPDNSNLIAQNSFHPSSVPVTDAR